MKYRDDEALNFLRFCSDDDLDPLVAYLTKDKDGSPRWSEALTKTEKYQAHAPSHGLYWELIGAELQTFGANSIATFVRGGEGILYREMLSDVCDKMKVNYHSKAPTELIERNLLMKLLTDSLEKMDENAKRALIEALRIPATDLSGQAITAALQLAVNAGGFAAYQLSVIVANAVARAVLQRGLSLGVNAGLTRAIGVAAGPIGWVLTGLWTISSLAGPAYRVTIPSTVHVAFLRAKFMDDQQKAGKI